ncbi:hypothetical protein OAB00_04295 [Akkermansiaceae bacterium]|nr:hypothetical protein [Akkermansiaceae bacterium]
MIKFAIIAILSGVALGLVFKGSFIHLLLSLAAMFLIVLPVILFLSAWIILSKMALEKVNKKLIITYSSTLITLVAILASMGVGSFMHSLEIKEAREYVNVLIPELEKYKDLNGHYPSDLSIISALTPPEILQKVNSYTSDDDSFCFLFKDTSTMMSGYRFDSSIGSWQYFD